MLLIIAAIISSAVTPHMSQGVSTKGLKAWMCQVGALQCIWETLSRVACFGKDSKHVASNQQPSFSFFISVFFSEENQLTLYHGHIKSRNPSVRIQASVCQCDASCLVPAIDCINQKKLWVLSVTGKEVKIHNSRRTQVSVSNASTSGEKRTRKEPNTCSLV